MFIPITLIVLSVVVLFFYVNLLSTKRNSELVKLEKEKVNQNEKYDFMVKKKKQLIKEVEDKKRQLESLRNSEYGIKTISSKDLDVVEVDEDAKVGNYLVQQGKVTLEQNEKVLAKIKLLRMDYIGTCLAMGFIDIDTAKKAIKANKITSKSAGLS